MKKTIELTISIVLYKNNIEQIKKSIYSVLKSKLNFKIYLVDNSPTSDLEILRSVDSKIEYVFNNANLGFGKAHNIALRKSIEEKVPYHLVLNPDVYFGEGALEELYDFMEKNKDIGLVMPKILYPSGEIQYLCKLLPTPFDLFGRRFLNFQPFKNYIEKRNEIYELRFTGYDKIMEVPYLSGCFMFLRTSVLEKVGLFDENIFMYLEDTDLSRRIHKVAKTVFYPNTYIYHEYEKGSYKNWKLLTYHIKSAIYYFNKWGWVFDKERNQMNNRARLKLNI
ncbi:glycosyltransferase family 2 protein [Deferribacteraceae bacterium V6Fe1]|nr:glycosyltransferase family 2 protein [Deferribacteraceae bacterium V6Fe1]